MGTPFPHSQVLQTLPFCGSAPKGEVDSQAPPAEVWPTCRPHRGDTIHLIPIPRGVAHSCHAPKEVAHSCHALRGVAHSQSPPQGSGSRSGPTPEEQLGQKRGPQRSGSLTAHAPGGAAHNQSWPQASIALPHPPGSPHLQPQLQCDAQQRGVWWGANRGGCLAGVLRQLEEQGGRVDVLLDGAQYRV